MATSKLRIVRLFGRDVLKPQPGPRDDREEPLRAAAGRRANDLVETPATTGINNTRTRKFKNSESNFTTEKATIETSITTIKKLVPHRGCCRRLLPRVFDRQLFARFPRVDDLVLRAVILEDPADVALSSEKLDDHYQEERHADQPVDQVERHRRADGMKRRSDPAPRRPRTTRRSPNARLSSRRRR